MKRYKVISSICICVPQRTKLRIGDEKPESWFLSGQLAELIKGKFIAEVGGQVEAVPDMVIKSDDTPPEVDLSKMSISDLQELAVSRGIEYDIDATKKELIKLLK